MKDNDSNKHQGEMITHCAIRVSGASEITIYGSKLVNGYEGINTTICCTLSHLNKPEGDRSNTHVVIETGYYTSAGRFLNQYEAFVLAKQNNQLKPQSLINRPLQPFEINLEI